MPILHRLMNSGRRSLSLLLPGCMALLLAGPCVAGDPPSDPARPAAWQVSPDLEVLELQPGLWLHTSWHTFANGSRFPSNGLIVREDDSVLVIDTAWGNDLTEALLDWIDAELGLPVSSVIATHAHDDRMGGAPALADRDIPLFAHPLSIEPAVEQGWPPPRSIGDLAAGDSLEFGPVEIFYPGPAHTVDNLMVWLPGERLLVGGCAVKSADATDLGFVGDAVLDQWPDSIRRAGERYPDAERVLPGHGAIGGGPELLHHTLQLLGQPDQGAGTVGMEEE